MKWSIHNNYSFVCQCPPLPHLFSSGQPSSQRSAQPPRHAAITVIVQTWGRFIKGIISELCAILCYYCSLDKWLRKHVWVSVHCSLDDEWRKLYKQHPMSKFLKRDSAYTYLFIPVTRTIQCYQQTLINGGWWAARVDPLPLSSRRQITFRNKLLQGQGGGGPSGHEGGGMTNPLHRVTITHVGTSNLHNQYTIRGI